MRASGNRASPCELASVGRNSCGTRRSELRRSACVWTSAALSCERTSTERIGVWRERSEEGSGSKRDPRERSEQSNIARAAHKESADPLIDVAPAPRFTRLEASDHRMDGLGKVPLGMPAD